MDPALLLLVGLAVILLLQFNRVRRQQRDVRETQSELEVGRRVLTAAGMIGVVVEVDGDEVVLASEGEHHTRWVRSAVVRVLPVAGADDEVLPDEPAPGEQPGTDPDKSS